MSKDKCERLNAKDMRIRTRIIEVDDFFLWCKYVCWQHSLFCNPFDGINATTRMGYMFRGQSNDEWPIESTFRRLYCDKGVFHPPNIVADGIERFLRIKELNIIAQFRRDAHRHLLQEPQDIIEWLSLMRHHGAPSRIVDFSESPFVALHFAVAENLNRPCAVWALPLEDAWKMRQLATKAFRRKNALGSKRHASCCMKEMPFLLIDWEREINEKYEYVNYMMGRSGKGTPIKCSRKNAEIVIVKPRYNNARICAQSGLLAIPTVLSMSFMENVTNGYISINDHKDSKDEKCDHPEKLSGLELGDFLDLRGDIIKFVFSNDVIRDAKSFLEAAGITEKTLFPDLDGISQQFRL